MLRSPRGSPTCAVLLHCYHGQPRSSASTPTLSLSIHSNADGGKGKTVRGPPLRLAQRRPPRMPTKLTRVYVVLTTAATNLMPCASEGAAVFRTSCVAIPSDDHSFESVLPFPPEGFVGFSRLQYRRSQLLFVIRSDPINTFL